MVVLCQNRVTPKIMLPNHLHTWYTAIWNDKYDRNILAYVIKYLKLTGIGPCHVEFNAFHIMTDCIPVHVASCWNSFPMKASMSIFYTVNSMNGDVLVTQKGRASAANALPLKDIIMEEVNLAKPSRFLIAEINTNQVVTLLWLQMPGYISEGSATHKHSICYMNNRLWIPLDNNHHVLTLYQIS